MKATEVTAGPAENNGSLLPGLWRDSLYVTCGLTACTPGSAQGPTLGNEYGKTLPLRFYYFSTATLCLRPTHAHLSLQYCSNICAKIIKMVQCFLLFTAILYPLKCLVWILRRVVLIANIMRRCRTTCGFRKKTTVN